MVECFKCGMPDTRTVLRDAISNEGIVKICGKCSAEESLPLVRVQSVDDAKEVEANQSVHDRLTSISGVASQRVIPQSADLDKQEVSLRDIVDRNFAERVPKTHGNRDDLVRNFHWIVMRARRMKKITTKQLAEEIAESEKAVKAAERGVLPEGDYTLVKKLERHLGINILNQEVGMKVREIQPDNMDLRDESTTKFLTIADLQEMKQKRETEVMAPEQEIMNVPEIDESAPLGESNMEFGGNDEYIDICEEEVDGMDEDIDFEEKDLTQGEMNDLIFGRKGKE